jgi:hypothetical protein
MCTSCMLNVNARADLGVSNGLGFTMLVPTEAATCANVRRDEYTVQPVKTA